MKTYEIKLDLENEIYAPSNVLFSLSRDDFDSVQLELLVTSDGDKIDLTGRTLELAIKKPSGLTVYQSVELDDAVNGRATALLSRQAYIEAGIHKAELYIRWGNQLAVTSAFYFRSREAIMGTTNVESENDWSAIHTALFSFAKKPLLVEGVPNAIPEYIGQLAFDVLNKRAFIAGDFSVDSWRLLEAGEGGGGIVSWNDILGKPTLFPADEHFHPIEEIEGLQEILDTKADEGTTTAPEDHTHTWGEITEKPEEFPPSTHSHEIQEVNGLQVELDGKADLVHGHGWDEISDTPATFPAEDHTHSWTEVTEKPTTFPAEDHTHSWGEVTEKPEVFPPEDHTHDEYLTEAEADNRYALRDAEGGITESVEWDNVINKPSVFTPEIHTHEMTEINGLPAALDDKADAADLDGKANVVHEHTWDQITEKPTEFPPEDHVHEQYMTIEETDLFYAKKEELLEKADINHSHTWGEVTEKPTTFPAEDHTHSWGEVTEKPETFPPDVHTHSWVEVTEKPTEFTPEAHGHTWDEVTDKPTEFPAETHAHTWTEVTEKPETFPPDVHTHSWEDVTEKPSVFPAEDHTHVWNDVTEKPTEFTPEAHGHTWDEVTEKPQTFTPPLASGAVVGGTRIGNGLRMVGEYLTIREGAGIKVNPETISLDVDRGQTDNWYAPLEALGGLTFWRGSQTEYDAIEPKDPNRIYFVT